MSKQKTQISWEGQRAEILETGSFLGKMSISAPHCFGMAQLEGRKEQKEAILKERAWERLVSGCSWSMPVYPAPEGL